jgi:hypothetical protein
MKKGLRAALGDRDGDEEIEMSLIIHPGYFLL